MLAVHGAIAYVTTQHAGAKCARVDDARWVCTCGSQAELDKMTSIQAIHAKRLGAIDYALNHLQGPSKAV